MVVRLTKFSELLWTTNVASWVV